MSPASVPSCSVSDESSMAWAIVEAVPGEPMTRSVSPLRPILTGMSARIRRSRSSDRGGRTARSSGAT